MLFLSTKAIKLFFEDHQKLRFLFKFLFCALQCSQKTIRTVGRCIWNDIVALCFKIKTKILTTHMNRQEGHEKILILKEEAKIKQGREDTPFTTFK